MAQLTIDQAFQLARQHHQAGRLPQAEQLYRQVLARQASHADALHFLGLIALQAGQRDAAVDLIRRALAVRPAFPEAQCNLGNALFEKKDFAAAIVAYRQAIALRANNPDTYRNLGMALKAAGQLDESMAAFREAIVLRPNFAEAYNNLGIVLKAKGKLDEAVGAYRQAIALKPAWHVAHNNLGNALTDTGRLDEAIAAYRHAIALKPDYPEAHNNLGKVLHDKGRLDEAIALHRRAVALKPDYAEAASNLGNVLGEIGKLDEAIATLRHAIAVKPDYAEAYSNLGNALINAGRADEAMAASRRAIALMPDSPEAHRNLGLALLVQGDLPQGWVEYEWRWKCEDFLSPREFPQPRWDGRPLERGTILLHCEQGFGDTLQFIRYVPLVAQRGRRIVIGCQPELKRLLKSMVRDERIDHAGDCIVVAHGDPLPAFDVHCPLLSLPLVLGTTLENIPRQVPYLQADLSAAGKWRERLAGGAGYLEVGLTWAGNKSHKNNRNRSMALSAFRLLARTPGVRFHSLQKGESADQAPTAGLELIDWTAELKDFADTAALIANLDLVITVDTAVAHLAGAMGKPVWVLLPFAPDWRWMLKRDDSPWYPTMRLFRQPSLGDWESVMSQVAKALADRVRGGVRGSQEIPIP